jgi:uncharacterized membrane protein
MSTSTPAAVAAPSHFLLGKHRVEALADGLFAIVMTLLVLELKVPDLPRPVTDAQIVKEMAPLGRVFFSFVMTFVLASIFWMSQQTILTATRTLDRLGASLHLLAMMFVALLPFSTAMLGRYINTRFAYGLYFGNQALVALVLCVEWFRERSNRNLGDISREVEQRISIRVVSMTAVMLSACIAGSFNPRLAFYGALPAILGTRFYMRRLKKA